jgi:hypothetical protein
MGRTVPSFRNVIAQEKQEWKLFRNALDKSEPVDINLLICSKFDSHIGKTTC